MKLSRSQATIILQAIHYWRDHEYIPENIALSLEQSLQTVKFDWRRVAKYSFWVAVACLVISIAAVFADKELRALLAVVFNAPHVIKFISLSVLSICLYGIGGYRRRKHPQTFYRNESIFFLGILVTAGAIYQFGRIYGTEAGYFSNLLLLSYVVYGGLGLYLKSSLIWVFSLFALGGWMGAETGYMSGWGAYYLGMNYPLRFCLFGFFLIFFAYGLQLFQRTQYFVRSTLAMGLLYLFIALWILSIFGNYGDIRTWYDVSQRELFHWSILFALVAFASIYHGVRYDDAMTKGFGLAFLFINLYTRYFEYCWNMTHKAVFFAILGVSFWILGAKAEKIWLIGEKDSITTR
jgi:hypothetical protein